MQLPLTLAWLVDEASTVDGPDHFLASLGGKLIDDGVPLAGGALTLAATHPIIVSRTWLWRAETAAVIEALSFGSSGSARQGTGLEQSKVGRDWLAALGTDWRDQLRPAGATPGMDGRRGAACGLARTPPDARTV